nr:hypothetical protein GCM10020063_001940 [Dactylosporangium thailandense]
MQIYKQKLSLINGLYSDLEKRVLEHFAKVRDAKRATLFPAHIRRHVGEEAFRKLIEDEFKLESGVVLKALDGIEKFPGNVVTLPAGHTLLLWQLFRDGYLEQIPGSEISISGVVLREDYRLTEAGLDFLDRWITADALNPGDYDRCDCGVGKCFSHKIRSGEVTGGLPRPPQGSTSTRG